MIISSIVFLLLSSLVCIFSIIFLSYASLLPHAIGIRKVLDFDFNFDFDPNSGVLLDSSRDRSLPIYGLCYYAFLVFLILSNKEVV